jgi:hypothetical protein
MHNLQNLEEVPKKLKERLQNQLSQTTTLEATPIEIG